MDHLLDCFENFRCEIITKGLMITNELLIGATTLSLSGLLKRCLVSFDEEVRNEQHIPLLKCINNILDLGEKHSLLCIELPEYLEYLRNICNTFSSVKHTVPTAIKYEIIKLVYQFTCNVVTEHHIETASLLRTVMPLIYGYYYPNMKATMKEQLFELCAIFIDVHYLRSENFQTIIPIGNQQKQTWMMQLEKIFDIVKMEVKYKSRRLNSDIDKHFLVLAASISHLIFWDILFKRASHRQRKIAKYSTKFQGLLDLASVGENGLSWGWFIILSECMTKYSHLIDETDYQPMLKVLVTFQKDAMYTTEVHSVANYCKVLLTKEPQLEGNGFFNADLWKKITETALKQLLQKSRDGDEQQILVQLLIQSKKIPSESLLSLVRSLTENSDFRTDTCLNTIRLAIKHYGEIFLAGSKTVASLLNWLRSMMNDKAINRKLAAFVVSQFIVENDAVDENLTPNFDDDSKLTNLEIIHEALNYSCLKKVIFIESQNKVSNIKEQSGKLPKLLVNEENFKILLEAIDFGSQTIGQQDATDLIKNMSEMEIMLVLLSTFAKRGVFGKNDLCLSAVVEKAEILLNAIELGKTDIKVLEEAHITDILNKLESVLGILNEPVLRALIRNDDNQTIVEFLCKGSYWFSDESAMFDDGDTAYRRKLALECIKVLAVCYISQDNFNYIDNFMMDFDCLVEVESILSIIEVFCKQHAQSYISMWILTNIKTISQKHYENLNISLALIKLLPAIAKYTKPYPKCSDDIMKIILWFLELSYNKRYPINLVANLLVTLRNIVKIYTEQIKREELVQIYGFINKFLQLPCKLIQYAAVDCWSHLINDKWLFEDSIVIPFKHIGLCDMLFEMIGLLDLAVADSYQRQYPVAMQLLLSAFGLNYYLEERAIIHLTAHGLLSQKDARQLLHGIAKHLDRDVEIVLNNNIIPVAIDWFSRTKSDNVFENPPWACFVEDKMKFQHSHREVLLFCALSTNYDLIHRISNRINTNLQQKTISICLSILLPKFCKANLPAPIYECNIEKLMINMKKAKLSTELAECNKDCLWEVFYHLIKNVWDPLKFKELCGFKMKWPKKNVIDHKSFEQCITHLMSILFTNSKAMFDSVMKRCPLQIVYLLTAIKADLENSYYVEMKLFNLFHYCLLLHCLVASFSSSFQIGLLSQIRGYLIRDALCYLCHILKTSNENILIYKSVSHFLYVFCELLLPRHADFVGQNLNLLAQTLICTSNKNAAVLTENSLKILDLLICRNSTKLSKSIELLDDFPTEEVFSNFREIHEQIKYSNQSRSLIDEINNFLQVENRGAAGFQNIRNCLCNKKDELIVACNFNNKTIEEIRASPIFKLLRLLLSTIKSKNDETQIEAAKCLGELGPVNLTTVALYSDFNESCYEKFSTEEKSFQHFISKMFHALESILTMGNQKTRKLANDICCVFVDSDVGSKCLVSTPLLHIFVKWFDNKLGTGEFCRKISFAKAVDLTEPTSYNLWITRFAAQVYACIHNESIKELAASDVYFSEQTLVAFFKFILSTNDKYYLETVEKMVERFFARTVFCKTPKNKGHFQNTKVYIDKPTTKFFLNIVECIRIHNQISTQKLKMDYLHVAEASIYCEAYFMAVISLEMHALSDETQQSRPGVLENEDFLSIARKAYSSIGCIDALNVFFNPINSRLECESLPNRWDAVLLEFDANGTELSIASNIGTNHRDSEVLLRLGNWDIELTNTDKLANCDTQEDLEKHFQNYYYFALKAVKRMDEENTVYAVNAARKVVVDILNIVSSECALNISKYIIWLQMLQQIEDFCVIQFPKSSQFVDVLEKWDKISDMHCFNCKELALSQKITLFNIAGIRAQKNIKEFYGEKNVVGEHLLNLIRECNTSGNLNSAIRIIEKIRNLDISNELKIKAAIEEAELNWQMGNAALAKSILVEVAKKDEYASCFTRVDVLRIYAGSLGESKSESISRVHTSFADTINLFKATALSNAIDDDYFRHKKINQSLAKYADQAYNQVVAHINSEDFQKKKSLMDKNSICNSEIKAIEQERITYLCLAIDYYISYCKLDESVKTMEISRMISLWFLNKDVTEVSNLINDKITSIPSYKFIFVLNQITAVLGRDDELDGILQRLLVTCSLEHPHHTLPYILAIAHENLDPSSSSEVLSRKINIAKSIMKQLQHSYAGSVLDQMEIMWKSLIAFANADCVNNCALLNLKNLVNQVQCPTVELPISFNMQYSSAITSIFTWKPGFLKVGGVNSVKKITCVCSDGVQRHQLLKKGNDDVRQDALIQQVFGVVNDFLLQNRATPKLKIRTYKVVPLSMRSGILEWCENTSPIAFYLRGAHKKYRPNDWSNIKCYKQLLDKHKGSFEERYETYKEVCSNFKPVFHHFFFENFLSPELWFEKRLAYMNSVATNSMVGYILGLGDRHLENILFDNISAEIVHIDFGIAFEQGKVLPTPETVPFRLTRDIVAPFGVCGVEGIFRKSCEKTMEVLQQNHSVLTTLLEVLLYDPLNIRIVNPPSNDSTNLDKGDKNSTAQRALKRVKVKLMGMEDIESGLNSVEDQVQRLIRQAMDPRNLCLLYPGWTPHL